MHTAKDQKGPHLGPHPEPTYLHTKFSLTLLQYSKFLQNVTTICPVNNTEFQRKIGFDLLDDSGFELFCFLLYCDSEMRS